MSYLEWPIVRVLVVLSAIACTGRAQFYRQDGVGSDLGSVLFLVVAGFFVWLFSRATRKKKTTSVASDHSAFSNRGNSRRGYRQQLGARTEGEEVASPGKKRVSEIAAARSFVDRVIEDIHKSWPEIARDLNSEFQQGVSEKPGRNELDFICAVITVHLQAVSNLLPSDQAARVRSHVMDRICTPKLGSYPASTIDEYQEVWDQSLRDEENPILGVAAALAERFARDSVKAGIGVHRDPLTVMFLSEQLVGIDIGWWKAQTQRHELVP